jgi:hypothetical protein
MGVVLFTKNEDSTRSSFQFVFKVFIAIVVSTGLGWGIIHHMSKLARGTEKVWKFTSAFLFTPLAIFAVLRLAAKYLDCDIRVTDSFAFGFAIGIMGKLSAMSFDGSESIKLIVHDDKGKVFEVCLDNKNMLVGDVRNKIAEAGGIAPANRVLIETGKGGFYQDLSTPLVPLLINSNVSYTTDFFGSKIFVCYVKINEEVKVESDSFDENDKNPSTKMNNTRKLIAMLNSRAEVRLEEEYMLYGRLQSSGPETKPFHIYMVDKFIAGSLTAPSPVQYIRFESWHHLSEGAYRDSETLSVSDNNFSVESSKKGGTGSPKSESLLQPLMLTNILKRPQKELGKPIHNGDLIVLQNDHK